MKNSATIPAIIPALRFEWISIGSRVDQSFKMTSTTAEVVAAQLAPQRLLTLRTPREGVSLTDYRGTRGKTNLTV